MDFEPRQGIEVILLADPFDNEFDPIARETSKVLIPVANTPILDYNLSWLLKNDVEQIIIYTKHTHSYTQIKNHVISFMTKHPSSQVKVQVLFSSEEIGSPGDVLRDLYSRNIIMGDFVFMRGDIIANFDLKNVLSVHRDFVSADPKAVMTRVLLPHMKESISLRLTTLATSTGKILEYERHRLGFSATFSSKFKPRARNVYMNYQLTDTSVTICSNSVLSLFTDNFDYTTIDSMVSSLVSPDDLNDCNVYQFIERNGSGITIAAWPDYVRAVSSVIARDFAPMCPEVSLSSGRQRYKMCNVMNKSYLAKNQISLGRNKELFCKEGIVLGESFEAPSSAIINKSTFGNFCKVGEKVDITSCFVGNNCTIGNNCKMVSCYLGDNVTISDNSVLEEGCVISSGVSLPANTNLTNATLVANKKIHESLDDFEKEEEVVNLSPSAVVFVAVKKPDNGMRRNEDGAYLPVWGMRESDAFDPETEVSVEDDESDFDEVDAERAELDEDERTELDFFHEVMDTLVTGLKENTDASKVVLEINGSRHAYNISLEKMQAVVLQGIMRCYEDEKSEITQYSFESSNNKFATWPDIKKGLHRYKEVLEKYMKTYSDYLNSLLRAIVDDERVLGVSEKILYELTQELELVEDEKVLVWFYRGDKTSPVFYKLKEKVSRFLNWLQEADESSSEESD